MLKPCRTERGPQTSETTRTDQSFAVALLPVADGRRAQYLGVHHTYCRSDLARHDGRDDVRFGRDGARPLVLRHDLYLRHLQLPAWYSL